MTTVAVYAPEPIRPMTQDVLQGVFENYDGLITEVIRWDRTVDPTTPVLCLGKLPEIPPPNTFKTVSQNQLLSVGSATQELSAAIDLIVTPPKLRDFQYTVWKTRHAGDLEKVFGNIIVVDIETGGSLKTMLREENWLLSVALYDGKTNIVLAEEWLDNPYNRIALAKFLAKPNRKLIAHNMKFDFRSLSAQLGVQIYGHLDTMLLHHALNSGAKEHGLKALCAKYLGAPDWDSGTKPYVTSNYKNVDELPATHYYPTNVWNKYFELHGKIPVGFENIPRVMLYEYNAWDVYWTWHLMEYLTNLTDDATLRVAIHEYKMGNFFQDVEARGLSINVEWMDELEEEFLTEKAEYLDKIQAIAGENFNPNSPKQVKEFFESKEIKVKKTDVESIKAIVEESGDLSNEIVEFCQLLLAIRGVTKLHGTYIKGFRSRMHDRKVYTTYNVHGTNTGRLSSSDPNVQNIPRDKRLRKLFTVEDTEEYDFLEVDYSQAELRVMAVLSGDEYLISLFQPGMPDFFDSLLPVAFPTADIGSWDAQERKDNRANLKGVIYGLSYGRGAPAIAKALKMHPWEAQDIIDNYFAAAPKFAAWRAMITDAALDPDAVISTVFGRKYQAEVITGRNRQNVINSALAFTPQSTASDICVSAAIEINKWIGNFGAHIITSVHDAINVQVPKKHTEEVAALMKQEMAAAAVRVFGSIVPFATEAEWGTTWGTTNVNGIEKE